MRSCSILDLDVVPDLYVMNDADINAMTIGAKTPIVIINSSMLRSFDDRRWRRSSAHEVAHVLSEHYCYTTALRPPEPVPPRRTPRSLLLGLPVRAMYLALLEWSRAAELTADRAAALVMADPLQPCRVLMALAGGSVPGMSFEAFLKQATEYESEDDLFSRHARFWSELNLTHPVAVRRVKELMEWVQSGAYDRIRDGDYLRRGEEPPPSAEFEDAVAHYRRALRPDPRPGGGGRPGAGHALGGWLERLGSSTPGRGRRGRGRRPLLRHGSGGRRNGPAADSTPPATSAHRGVFLNRAESHNGARRTAVAGGGARYARPRETCVRVACRAGLEERMAEHGRQTTVGSAAYRILFEHSPEGVLFCTHDGRVTAANPAACAMLGMCTEEICASAATALIDQDDPRWVLGESPSGSAPVGGRRRPGCAGATAPSSRSR